MFNKMTLIITVNGKRTSRNVRNFWMMEGRYAVTEMDGNTTLYDASQVTYFSIWSANLVDNADDNKIF